MRTLLPFLKLYRRHLFLLTFGVVLAVLTLLASIGLLTLSGWFLAACSTAGAAGLFSFNYLLPAAGVRGAAIIRTAARYAERLVSHEGTFRVLEHLRVFTFSKLIPLSPAGLNRFSQGDLLHRLVADVDTLDHLYLRVLSPLTGAFVVIVAVTAGLSWFDWQLAAFIGCILLLTLLLLPPVFYCAGRVAGNDLTRLRAQYRSQLTGWLQSQAELRIYGAAPRFRLELDETESLWQQAQQKQAQLTGMSQALLLVITGLMVTLVLWLSADGIGDMDTPGALIALFVFCSLAAFEALAPVGNAFQHLGQVIASANRVAQILAQKPALHFPHTPINKNHGAGLSMRNLSFRYDSGVSALENFSLDIAPGEHIALLGRTGCGKSTLLQLLTRAWEPQQGEIWLNGHRLPSWDEASLRKLTSVVTQRVHIFSNTLRDNLLLASPGSSDSRLTEVLQRVGLQNLLEDGQGLNAWLGEGGRQLSGGEQRRLGFARALLHDGSLLLLDEPTEGLDAETEQQILQLLQEIAQDKTMIMVTHRQQGLHLFDRICVMDGGKLVEQGNHLELISKESHYSAFYQRIAL